MSLRRIFLIAALLLRAEPSWAQTRPMPDQPSAAIVSSIQRLFDSWSAQFVEEGNASPGRWSYGSSGNDVATRARQAGWPGLCKATVAQFGPEHDMPLATHQAYKVVGSLKPLPNWTEQYKADLASRCAGAGRVLAGSADGEMFFVDSTPRDIGPWLAARALELTTQQARDGAVRIACGTPADAACLRVSSGGDALRLGKLIEVKAGPCKNGDPSCVHVAGEFFVSASDLALHTWVLSLVEKVKLADRYNRDVEAVTNASLVRGGFIR